MRELSTHPAEWIANVGMKILLAANECIRMPSAQPRALKIHSENQYAKVNLLEMH